MLGRHPLEAAAETNAGSDCATVAGGELSRTDGADQQPGKLLIRRRQGVDEPGAHHANGHITDGGARGQRRGRRVVIELKRSGLREGDVAPPAVADRRVDSHGRWTRYAIARLRPNVAAESKANEGHYIGGLRR